jgi:Dyp-type peroxidase family
MDGSYFVLRRLRQDVAGFRRFLDQTAQQEGRSEALVGAKLVGRYASGAPAEALNTQIPNVSTTNQNEDPGLVNPVLLDERHINDFDYKGVDDQGVNVPVSAHIRKVYPRNAEPPGEAFAETRRVVRRGIAYGLSFREDAPTGSPEAGDATFPYDRGLIFICYQSSISDKFEFLQRIWVNSFDSPAPGGGQDPIIGQKDSQRTLFVPGFAQDHLTLQRWVITTGGDYFFAPSLAALETLGGMTSSSP